MTSATVESNKAIAEYRFKLEENQEFGGIGFTLLSSDREYFEPALNALQFTHDILEHPEKPHSNGYVDEFMALGGMYWVRYETSYCSPIEKYSRSLEDRDVVSDIMNLLQYAWMSDDRDLPVCDRDLDDYGQDKFDQLINSTIFDDAVELLESEMRCRDEDIPAILDWVEPLEETVLRWIAVGYQETIKRYGDRDNCEIARIFEEIEIAVNRFKKDWEEYGEVESTLTINFERLTVAIADPFEDEEYFDSDDEDEDF